MQDGYYENAADCPQDSTDTHEARFKAPQSERMPSDNVEMVKRLKALPVVSIKSGKR